MFRICAIGCADAPVVMLKASAEASVEVPESHTLHRLSGNESYIFPCKPRTNKCNRLKHDQLNDSYIAHPGLAYLGGVAPGIPNLLTLACFLALRGNVWYMYLCQWVSKLPSAAFKHRIRWTIYS